MRTRLPFLLLWLLLSIGDAHAAYVPLTIATGLNADVIANGIGTASATTSTTLDGANYVFVANGWQQTATSTPITTGLPANGLINSAVTTGLTYQLAPYTGSNSLRISTNNTASTLTFQTVYAAQTLYFLAVTGSGTSTITVQLNFTDGTNQINTGIAVADWYGGANAAITGFQRLHRTNNTLDNNTNGPRIYQQTIAINAANQSKLISSMQVTRTASTGSSPTLNVLAVSIDQLAVSCAVPTAPTATSITTTSAVLNWNQTGTPVNYQIKYGAPGFNVNTAGTAVFTATKPYTLNPPLTPSTSYSYYVRAICSPGDTSAWSAVTNFTTACNAPSIVSKKDSFGCGTGMVILEATTTSGASVKWYAAATGGTALFTGNSFTTPVISTTTTYYAAAASGTCESSPRQAVVATIRPLPVVQLGNDTTLCPGVSLTLNAGNAGGSYIWSPGGQTTQTITTNAVGQYSVAVTVNNCSSKDTIVLTPGTAPVNSLPDTTNLCEGSTATLNAGNSGSTYNWSPGGATTQTINVNAGGTYDVMIKSVHGCAITSSTYVAMRPLPVDHLGNDTSICNVDMILLDAGNPGNSYAWNTGATAQTINTADSGLYTVTVTTPYNCVNTDSIHIAFRATPHTEGFNFIPRFFEELGKVEFSPLNPTNVLSYEWDFGDGTPLVTAMNTAHVYGNSGPYTVTLKVYNECSDFSVRQTINVDLPTGVVVLNKDAIQLTIYPNPAQSMLNISNQNTGYEIQEVTIYNTAGAAIYHSKADSKSSHQLSVAQFASGMYFVKVLTGKGFVNQRVQIVK